MENYCDISHEYSRLKKEYQTASEERQKEIEPRIVELYDELLRQQRATGCNNRRSQFGNYEIRQTDNLQIRPR